MDREPEPIIAAVEACEVSRIPAKNKRHFADFATELSSEHGLKQYTPQGPPRPQSECGHVFDGGHVQPSIARHTTGAVAFFV